MSMLEFWLVKELVISFKLYEDGTKSFLSPLAEARRLASASGYWKERETKIGSYLSPLLK